MCTHPVAYVYSSIAAYIQEDADVGVATDHHEYFVQLEETFAERVAKFMEYETIYRKRYSLVVELV